MLAGFLAVSFLLFAPADLHATTRFIGATTADNSQHAWFLAWLPAALGAHVNPMFSDRVIAPTGVNLMWNTWIPLPALVLSPLTLLAGPVAAFNTAVTLGVALSGFCMYLAALRYVRARGAAVAAGMAYGFAPFLLVHAYAGHSNLVIAFVPPLLLLSIDSIVVRQTGSARRAGLLLGLLMLTQLLITEELLASEAVAVAVGLVVLAMVGRHHLSGRWRHALAAVGWALLLFIPLAAYPLWFQFFGPEVPHALVADKNFVVTDLLNVVLPTYAQGVDPGFAQSVALHYMGNSGEWGGYIGLPMLVIAAWTAVRHWSMALVRVVSLSALVLLLVSFGSSLHVAGVDTHIPMPGTILAHLPVLENLLPARFAAYVALLTALLLAVFIDRMPRTVRSRRVLQTASVLLVVAFLPPLPFPTRPATTPPFFTTTRPRPYPENSRLLVLPFAHDFYTADAMRWQAEARMSFSMPEGYIITRLPSGQSVQGPAPSVTSVVFAGIVAGSTTLASVSRDQRASIAADLRGWNIEGVVLVDGTPHGDAVAELVGAIVGSGPGVDELGATYWAVP